MLVTVKTTDGKTAIEFGAEEVRYAGEKGFKPEEITIIMIEDAIIARTEYADIRPNKEMDEMIQAISKPSESAADWINRIREDDIVIARRSIHIISKVMSKLKKDNKDLRANLDLVSAENEMLKKAHRKQCKKGKTQKTDRLSAGCQ